MQALIHDNVSARVPINRTVGIQSQTFRVSIATIAQNG